MRATRALFVTSLLVASCTSETTAPPAGGGSNASNGPGSTGAPKQAPPEDQPVVDPVLDPNGQDCSGQPGELYARSARALRATEEIPLCRFAGSVLLVVNVASYCGNTPQYTPLQALYEKYKA